MRRQTEPQKLLLAGLYKDTNLGDRIIYDCVKNVLEQCGDAEIEPLYLVPELNVFERGMLKVCRMIKLQKTSYYNLVSHFYKNHFAKAVRSCDKVVFAGGGIIKWRYQFFGAVVTAIIKCAEKYRKPVYFNACGVEGYDGNDERCRILKKALNSDSVRYISVRDDIECLNRNYITNPKIKTALVADPAVFAGKVYGIQKQKSDVIGVGLIRGGIFKDNKVDFSAGELCDFYISFINRLQNEGYKFRLFINGLELDLELADRICEVCGLNRDEIIVPKTAEELVKTVSSFLCVVSGRLHACIAAYSLGIPAVGLGWNDKLKLFGRNIGFPERFIEPKNLTAEYVFEQMKNAISQGYDEEKRKSFEQTQVQSIKEIFYD